MKSGEWEAHCTKHNAIHFIHHNRITHDDTFFLPSCRLLPLPSLSFHLPLQIFPPPPHFSSTSILILPSPLSVCLLSTSPIPSPSFFPLPYLPSYSHPLFSPHSPLIVFPLPPSTLTSHQEALIELKVAGELFEQLVDAVQPLQEDRAVLVLVEEGATQSKLMAKGQPLTLNQELETLHVVMVM